MRKAYLHIGCGKTGSSSLQSYLSFNQKIENIKTNEKLLYCCILEDGSIIYGDELQQRAERNQLKYFSSAPRIAKIELLGQLKQNLDKVFEAGYAPIFSHESWWQRPNDFRDSDFFSNLNISADVIVYVRPQVDWFNSAWWQWFAWNDAFKKPQDVIDAWGCNFMLWGSHISDWAKLAGVNKLTVRLQPSDIIADFLSLFEQPIEPGITKQYKVNSTLPKILIKLLLKYPFLRKLHDARIAIFISKLLRLDGESPWVIDTELTQQIIKSTRQDNEILLSMLDKPSQAIMIKDLRWWDSGYYNKYFISSEQDLQLTRKELFSILAQGFRSLVKTSKL